MGKILTLFLLFSSTSTFAKTVHYELTVKNQPVNMSGKKTVDFSLIVNGGIPAPTLEFTEGDDAEIVVRNELTNSDEDVSIHWHGILLPPLEDGVPFVNTPPIYPGQSRTFKFPIRQSGTYWYHSHTMLQEQKGVFGAIVIHPKKESIKADKEAVVVLSDWSDENADQVLRNLKKDGDYYLYKKGTMRSYFEALSKGKLINQLKNEWTRMGGMDLSDVGYDAFLINGKRESQLIEAHPGEKVRLRIINASSSTYFQVSLGGLLMGMAETYDVLFTVPEHKNYELRATAQDGTGHASAFIGMGEKVFAKDVPQPDLYATMDHSMHGMNHAAIPRTNHSANHSHHHAEPMPMTNKSEIVDMLSVDKLKALEPMNFPKNAKVHDLKLVLDGDMRRYIWHINGSCSQTTVLEQALNTNSRL
jgi:FtsP/CotA-like multicopper oxidase with cupredoxin domain